ncbi:BZ3500_MvSof-1268-A1-R1_Chr5-3g08217 [Microbotryum saponariae]|uniref:BZ3500_MvSof-1268-A1-R1_Chr5-3g08217 protein n=1 Tax=Microbotryum saponariae TaxID=289078 RepID=A0A2X0NP36_9BASI|nr:BZ3500_MvSof-1268-A1-R1_Chr5-3g08217 [Microbotryum saponariae]SDA07976.1 BZ3501_MvSof-1269-A2-R1_Chr5-1g07361 [Microbotryum saponariae]
MLPLARTATPPRPGTHEKSRSIDQHPSFKPCHHVPSPSRARRVASSFARYLSLMLVALVVFGMTIVVLDYVLQLDARPYTVAGRLNTDWSRHIYAPSITRSQVTFSNVWPLEPMQAWDTIERVHTPDGRPRASLDANGRMFYVYPNGSKITPLTPLGTAADGAFRNLIYDRLEYMTTLENFLHHNFPQEDSDEQAPRSLINDMRVFFPLVKSPLYQWRSSRPRIPPKVYQNAPMRSETLRPDYVDTRAEWRDLIGWTMKAFVYGRSKMGEWVKERFDLNAGTDHGTEHEAEDDYEEPSMDDLPYERMPERVVPDPTRNVVTTYEALTSDQAKSDLWQILIILTSGGVYTPFNYRPTRKITEWGLWPTTDKACISRSGTSCQDPGLIAAVSFVAQDRSWRKRANRPIMLTPNYLAARRGHPVLVDTVRRVQLAILNNEGGPKSPIAVATHFTDAMINWMLVRHRLAWSELLGMSEKGWRYIGEREWGDVKLVPVDRFGR